MTQEQLVEYLKKEYDKEFAKLKREVDLLYAEYSQDIKLEIRTTKSDIGEYKPSKSHNKKLLDKEKRLSKRTDELFKEVSKLFQKTVANCYDLGYNGVKRTLTHPKEPKPLVYNAGRDNEITNNLWSGLHYTTRLDNHKSKLLFTMNQKINLGITKGDSIGRIYNEVYTTIQNQLSALDRLMKTEMSAMMIMGQLACYKANKVVEIVIVPDSRCCDHCQKQNGKLVQVSNAKVGVNIPIFHTSCRCTIKEYKGKDE